MTNMTIENTIDYDSIIVHVSISDQSGSDTFVVFSIDEAINRLNNIKERRNKNQVREDVLPLLEMMKGDQ